MVYKPGHYKDEVTNEAISQDENPDMHEERSQKDLEEMGVRKGIPHYAYRGLFHRVFHGYYGLFHGPYHGGIQY